MYDFTVIGGGIAGLTTSALLSKQGYNVLLIEQHYLLGGCAGYYQRPGGLVFDAGATTLSGFQANQPLAKILQDLSIELELKREEISQIIYTKNKTINRYRNLDKFIVELEKNWPDIEHRNFWIKLDSLSKSGWDFAENSKFFPPRGVQDLKSLSKVISSNLMHLIDFPKLFKHSLSKEYKQDLELMKFLDEQLLISTQTNSKNVGLLIAALGLTYPQDMAYPIGGMKQLINKISEKIPKSSIKMKTTLTQIIDKGKYWELNVTTRRVMKSLSQKILSLQSLTGISEI